MKKKYEMIPEGDMFRVKALRDFGNVRKGDVGGLIENECNLSHDGNSWVYDNAEVYGNARVYEDALVFNDAEVYGAAEVHGNASIFHKAQVYDNARVYGHSWVFNNAMVYGEAQVFGNAIIFESAKVCDNAQVFGNRTEVFGTAEISGKAEVSSKADYIIFKNWWSSGRYFTWTRSNDMWKVGCFFGSGEELIKKAYADSEEKGKQYEKIVKYVESIKAD